MSIGVATVTSVDKHVTSPWDDPEFSLVQA